MKRWLRVWILAAAPGVAWGQATTGLPAPSANGLNGVPVPTLATGYLYYNSGTNSFAFQAPSGSGSVNNCASAYAIAYYAASGTAVSCSAAFTGLGYFSTSAAPVAATGAQIAGAIGSNLVSNATTAVNFSGALSGDVTGTQSATTVGKVNGGSVPASAAVLGTNSSAQPAAATASQVSTLLQGLSGCSTSGYVLTPAGNDCVANGSGSGSAFNVLSSTQSTTNTSSSPAVTGLSFPTVPASSMAVGFCTGLWQNASTGASTYLLLNLNNAPSLLVATGTLNTGSGAGSSVTVSTTSSGSISLAHSSPAAANTNEFFSFFVTLQTGSNPVSAGLSYYTSTSADAASIVAGTTCGWTVY